MILGDHHIIESCREDRPAPLVYPFDPERVQPASYDVTLGPDFRLMNSIPHAIDPEVLLPDAAWNDVHIESGYAFHLPPNMFVLGATVEVLDLSGDNGRLVGTFTGKSSLARLGLLVHFTAGHADPGFKGTLTLEILNCATAPIILRPGMAIGQIIFTECGPVKRPYGHPSRRSKYMNQSMPTASRGWQDAI